MDGSPPGHPATRTKGQSLDRVRERVLRRTGIDASEGASYTNDDLVQLEYVLAKRKIDEQRRSDLRDRERLGEAHLDADWASVAISSERITEPLIQPVLRVIGMQLADHPEVEFTGAAPDWPPRWDRFELGDEAAFVPSWVSIYWDAGTVAEVPLLLETFDKHNLQTVQVFSRSEHRDHAKAYLDRLISDAKGPKSPYRGRLLKAEWGHGGLKFEVLPDPTERREDLVLPAAVWEVLDGNVYRMFERMPAIRAAGLGSNRGILLAGPPGTGKTATCKVLARELVGPITVVFVSSRVASGLLPYLYTEIAGFVPALVCLEDLDLLVGSREDGSAREPLFDFLTVLDGLMTQHHDVVTVATTNDPDAVDAGVRRAARFDRVIPFPLPSAFARERILEVYLRSIDHRVDVREVARATEGRTGADLRESIRSALLTGSDLLETGDLIRLAEDRPIAEVDGDESETVGADGPYL